MTPPLDEEPTNPSPGTIERTVDQVEEAGVSQCLYPAMMTDAEAEADLAPADIDRFYADCEQSEDDPENAPEVEVPTYEQIVAWAQREYIRLPIDPSPISYQPEGDWAAVNLDFIVYTDTEPQVFDVDALGANVVFTATPVHWSWDFGDGSPPLPTSSPGTPYPNQDVAHVYTSAHDGVTITVTTTWQGTFQINGGPTIPVPGAATTTAEAGPVEIVTFDVGLVPNHDDR